MTNKLISILSLNVNSLKPSLKRTELNECIIGATKPDIICLCETKLDQRIDSHEIFNNNYQVFRRDRNLYGGGVLVAVATSLKAAHLQDLSSEDCESLWVKVQTPEGDICVCSYYRPNKHNQTSLIGLNKLLTHFNNKHSLPLILCGDFNTPDIKWTSSNNVSYVSQYFLDILYEHSLVNHQTSSTFPKSNACLDLVLSNSPGLVAKTETIAGISDHLGVTTYLNINANQVNKDKPNTKTIHLYSKTDWDLVCQELTSFQAEYMSSNPTLRSVIQNWDLIKNQIHFLIKKYVPTRVIKLTANRKTWLDADLRKLLNKKRRLFHKNKDSATYKKLRSEIRNKLRKKEKEYLHNIAEQSASAPKMFWNYVNSLRKNTPSMPPLISDYSREECTTDLEKAKALNRFFFTNATNEKTCPPNMGPKQNHELLSSIVVDENGVTALLLKLNSNKSQGPDRIPPIFLKETAHIISPILTQLFQQSLCCGHLPKDWKTANITPIFKKGDKRKPINYRPISLTSQVGKLFEHIIASQITNFLDKHNIISQYQHGFRKNHSCDSQILSIIHDWASRLDRGEEVAAVALDFSKAFDTVPHRRLLAKLEHIGISGDLLAWMSAFLRGRDQRVVLNGACSPWLPVRSGVPQGSVLGPLLFLIYINDLGDQCESPLRLFADDALLYHKHTTKEDELQIQNDIKQLEKWSQKWLLNFNVAKCAHLEVRSSKESTCDAFSLQLQDKEITKADSIKYLGLTIGSNLSWSTHIHNICTTANQKLGILKRNFYRAPTRTKELLYKSIVRPTLEYCAPVWDPSSLASNPNLTLTKRLEAEQNRSIRFITGTIGMQTSITHQRNRLDLPTLQDRRRILRLNYFYRYVNGTLQVPGGPSPDHQPAYRTRHNTTNGHHFPIISTNKILLQRTYFHSTIPEWNALPPNVVEAPTTKCFTARLKRHLGLPIEDLEKELHCSD
jgi:endonuclease/exonuclease/phosphatase family metal-dependent hydrolase